MRQHATLDQPPLDRSTLDPADFILVHGADAYRKCLDAAPDGVTWLVRRAMTLYDFKTAEGRADAIAYLLNHLHHVQDYHARELVACSMMEAAIESPCAMDLLKCVILFLAARPQIAGRAV